jgi:hypothetical protein
MILGTYKRRKTGARIEARKTEPVDRTAARHKRRRVAVADYGIVFDEGCHRRILDFRFWIADFQFPIFNVLMLEDF